MFQDEARISAELQHENIAQVYNFGQFDNEFFMVMEYVPGLDLRELQKGLASQNKGIPIRITLKVLYDILQALDYAHHRVDTFGQSLNIVHRDVNPRNVMLSIRGEVKLIDFGVAKADNRMDQTVGHTIKGKFAYMAPEQIDPSVGAVDGRADLFAVGLMLYEMVAGRRPFYGLNEIQIMHKIMSVDIPDLPEAPDHPQPELLQSIFNIVKTQSPKERFDSAGEMAKAIDQASVACGGMASTAELAQFLRESMPERVEAIADRLTQYKTHATLASQNKIPIHPLTYTDTTNPSIATTLKRERPSLPDEESESESESEPTVTVKQTVQYGWMGLGGILLFGIGFATITHLNNNTTQPQLSPTQVGPPSSPKKTTAIPVDPIENPTVTPTIDAPNPTAASVDESSPATAKVQTSSKKPSPSAPKSSSKSNSSRSTQSNKSSRPASNTPVATSAGSLSKSSEKTSSASSVQKSPSEPVKKITPKPKVVMHTFYLMVGVDSGTRGLPVLYNGREITKTGAKKSVTLPLGTLKIEVQDPKSGTSVYKSITVQKGDPILTVQVRRM